MMLYTARLWYPDKLHIKPVKNSRVVHYSDPNYILLNIGIPENVGQAGLLDESFFAFEPESNNVVLVGQK